MQIVKYNRKLSKNLFSRAEITLGRANIAKASFRYNTDSNSAYRGKVKTGAATSVGVGYSKKFAENFKFVADASVNSDSGGLEVVTEAGFKSYISKRSSLRYTLQFIDDVRINFTYRKGSFVINIPLTISAFLSK